MTMIDKLPNEDDREALIDVVKRMSDGNPSVAFVTDETIADAILAAGFSRAAVPDAATEQAKEEIAPVRPSSGVDEDALAEVIEAEIDKLRHETRLYPDIYKAEVARAVVEWLKGYGGESRDAADKD